MMGRLAGLTVLLCSGAWGSTYVVTNTNDAGTGSLRWAISSANSHPGPDLVRFASGLDGQEIQPLTPLPAVTDDGTVINADIPDDGAPHVALNGSLAGSGYGLTVQADQCGVIGLAIYSWTLTGLVFDHAREGYVKRCHLGVGLDGTTPRHNGFGDLALETSHDCEIGGTSNRDCNVIAGGEAASLRVGILLSRAQHNQIRSNYIGVRRDGRGVLGDGGIGVQIEGGAGASVDNQIGHAAGGPSNCFGGLEVGVFLKAGSSRTTIMGNLFGIAPNGLSSVPIHYACVSLLDSPSNNIGRAVRHGGNVFAGGADTGLHLMGAGTTGNTVRANLFGLTATGTAQRRLRQAIYVGEGCGAQTIGGSTAEAGNHFTPRWSSSFGVFFANGGSGSLVRNNTFGIRPDGVDAAYPMLVSIVVLGPTIRVLENTIANCGHGIVAGSDGTVLRAYANRFVRCSEAIVVEDTAVASLGNLSNASATDDGGNVFDPSNTWHIRNETAGNIAAEGNDFGTILRSQINAKIWDRADDPALGRIDFDPLLGGVSPTGEAGPALVSGATAIPAAGGAEIAFSLSAPADVTVTVLNVAGRPVATVAQDRTAAAGLQRVLWSGQSANGTRAPNGQYLVRIVARGADGTQSTAVAALSIEH